MQGAGGLVVEVYCSAGLTGHVPLIGTQSLLEFTLIGLGAWGVVWQGARGHMGRGGDNDLREGNPWSGGSHVLCNSNCMFCSSA